MSALQESALCAAAGWRIAQGGPAKRESEWLRGRSPAFRLALASSVLAPDGWRDRQEASIHAICSDGPDWSEYLRLVDRHRTPAISWAVLKRIPQLEIPAPAAAELQKRSDACRIQAVRHFQILIAILKNFDQAGIPAMPMKGPLLSFEIYGDVGLRQSKDLDIAVRFQDLSRAEKCLQEADWSLSAEDASLSPHQREFLVLHEHHVTYMHPGRHCQLELHWRASWDTQEMTAWRWDRAVPSHWNRCPYRAMNPVDLVLYLCNHGSAHAWTRAKWLGDLARMTMSARVDWKTVVEEARSANQERPVLLCWRLLNEIFGIPMPDQSVRGPDWLPHVLLHKSLRELNNDAEQPLRSGLTSFMERIRSIGYRRQLWPYRSAWQNYSEAAFCSVNLTQLRLPDRLFWLYIPLRPFLWAWRNMRSRHT